MQKKQAKVFAGLLSMSLAVSLMTPLQGVSGQAARRKIALSKKSVTMTVGQKKTIRIKNAKGKRIKWSIKKKSIASYKKSGKYAVKLTAKKKGTTTLTCKVKNGKWKSYRCKVKVKKATLVRTPVATNDVVKTTEKPSSTAVVTMPSVPTQTPTDGQDKPQEPEKTPTATPTVSPSVAPTFDPNATISPSATVMPKPAVNITKSSDNKSYTFDVPYDTAYANSYVYAGMYDANGLLVALNRVEVTTTGNIRVSVSASSSDATAKLFIMKKDLAPITDVWSGNC